MPVTTNHGLVLPAVGADADTWGAKLNTALDAADDLFLPRSGAMTVSPFTPLPMTGSLVCVTPAAGAEGYASIRLPHGAAPTDNIADGDLWTTTAGVFARINGATVGPLAAAGGAVTVNNDNWSGSELTVENGGTGASDAAGARGNLGLGPLAVKSTVNNADWSGADLAVENGGTGASSASAARLNLGLGPLAVKSTVNNADWSGADLAVENGGTGASSPSAARSNLGLGALATRATVATAEIDNDAVTNGKLANMPAGRIKGRVSSGSGDPEDLTAAEVTALLGLAQRLPSAWVEASLTLGSVTSQSGYNATLSALGAGAYRVTFGSAMASADYAVLVCGTRSTGGGDVAVCSYHSRTTTKVDVVAETNGASALNPSSLSVLVFGPA